MTRTATAVFTGEAALLDGTASEVAAKPAVLARAELPPTKAIESSIKLANSEITCPQLARKFC